MQHAEDSPSAPQARSSRNAFVALGRYYLNGIPNSKIKPDTERAREMFSYAASYFGNADAQYDLARLYLKTPDASREDFRYGARWLGLAAHKGQHQAQALLGQMLFNGDRLPPQRARGLMWLTLGARQRRAGRDLDQGKLQSGDRESVRRRPRHGAADARALGAGPQGLDRPDLARGRWLLTPFPDRDPPRPAHGPTAFPRRARSYRRRHRSAGRSACGDSRRWSIRRPQFFCQAPAW